jgi:poly(3-hydroxybutyrate) depolymerase
MRRASEVNMMWYALVEQQRQWLRAWREGAGCAYGAWPAAAFMQAASSGCDDLLGPLLGLAQEPPPFAIGSVALDGGCSAVAEEIVACTPFCNLRRFTRAGARRNVLLCAPLAGHAAVTLRETVEALLADGDVYVTDWINARDVPLDAGRFGLDEYVTLLDGFIDTFAQDERPMHVVAVCQATFSALGALALRAQRALPPPASITLIGGPLDARINPGTLGKAATSHSIEWCRRHLLDVVPPGFAGHGRAVFPAYVQQAEIVTVYPQHYMSLIERYVRATLCGDTGALASACRALREYAALLDMPAEYFLDTVDVVFQRALLANRAWRVNGTLVEPAALRDVLLLTVEGTRDTVTGAGQTHAAQEMCSGVGPEARQRVDVKDCDHYGLFTGKRWRDDVHPVLQATFARAEAGLPQRRTAPQRRRTALG